jgi:hypothetical protein
MKAWRWWSGVAWTEWASDPSAPAPLLDQYQPGASAQPSYPSYPPTRSGPSLYGVSPQQRFAAQEKAAVWARRAFTGYPVVIVVGMLAAWAGSSSLRHTLHQLRVQMDSGATATTHVQTASPNPLGLVNLALFAGFYIFVLIWQYQAASTARLLGLPAVRTPGLGVGSWFIPIVNFWFPYQAIRDCLPPDDPSRIVVSRLWAFFIATLVASATTNVLALYGNPTGFIVGGVALALSAGFAVNGVRAVGLIGAAHRRLLTPA